MQTAPMHWSLCSRTAEKGEVALEEVEEVVEGGQEAVQKCQVCEISVDLT